MEINRRGMVRGGLALGVTTALAGLGGTLRAPASHAAVADIIGCTTWGARPPAKPISVLDTRPVKIIVHHTASPNSTDLSRAHAFSLARSIQNDHLDAKGFVDSGQHFTISRGGFTVEGRHRSLEALTGRTRQVVGAHCTGQNSVAIGIENEGTYSTETPPSALYAALVELCATICSGFGLRPYLIYGHRDFQSTECPGDRLFVKLTDLRAAVATRVGGDPTHPVWRNLRQGDRAEAVRSLQHLLRANGASITADGSFGPATEGAVVAFQRLRGATVDGIAGRQTWNHLAEPITRGARGEAVVAIQRQLTASGITTVADGSYGPATTAAVRTYQTRSRLPIDGVADARTWSRLVA
ncbi:MAG: peptidoglycan recognition protein family protein [Nocardioides sp.]